MKFLVVFIFTLSLFSDDVPEWFSKTEDANFFYGVGFASKNENPRLQHRIAEITARANLSENISVIVKSVLEKISLGDRKKITFLSYQKSKHLLKYSKIKKEWINSNGELFILISVPKEHIRRKNEKN